MILMLQVDRLAVSLLGSVSGLTFYSVPAGLSSRVNTVGGASASLFLPRAALLSSRGDWVELIEQYARARRLLAAAAASLLVPLCAVGGTFLGTWIGPEMAARGTPVLLVLAAGYGVVAVTSLDAVTLDGCGRPDLTAKAMFCWAVPAIGIVLVMGPRLGAVVIAWGVGGWLAATGLTSARLCREYLRRHGAVPSERGLWLAAAALLVGIGTPSVFLAQKSSGLVGSLSVMVVSLVATVSAAAFALLTAADRNWLLAGLRRRASK
jgi:O-antigen/teichoic acid export membrane protein